MKENASETHYGLTFLDLLKKDGLYGEFFSYEEYQALKLVSAKEHFEIFIRQTMFMDLHVFNDPRSSYTDFILLAKIRQLTTSAKFTSITWIDNLLFGLPYLLTVNMRIKKLEKQRASLAMIHD